MTGKKEAMKRVPVMRLHPIRNVPIDQYTTRLESSSTSMLP